MTTIKKALKLRPCPFCGGEAESDSQRYYRNATTGRPETAAAIYCTSCNADMTWCYRDTPEVEPEQVLLLLTDQWNARAGEPRSLTDIKDMLKAVLLPIVHEVALTDDDPRYKLAEQKVIAALASLESGGARERIARIIDPKAFDQKLHASEGWRSSWVTTRQSDALAKADAILATGLVAPDEAALRLAAQSPEPFGWLIEKDDPPVYHMVTDDHDAHWTADASKALRFARREDAQAYSDHIGWTSPPVRVVEHMWPASEATKSDDARTERG